MKHGSACDTRIPNVGYGIVCCLADIRVTRLLEVSRCTTSMIQLTMMVLAGDAACALRSHNGPSGLVRVHMTAVQVLWTEGSS